MSLSLPGLWLGLGVAVGLSDFLTIRPSDYRHTVDWIGRYNTRHMLQESEVVIIYEFLQCLELSVAWSTDIWSLLLYVFCVTFIATHFSGWHVCWCYRVWQTVIKNVCNVLPTEWSTTHSRQMLHSSLNISAVKVKQQLGLCVVTFAVRSISDTQQSWATLSRNFVAQQASVNFPSANNRQTNMASSDTGNDRIISTGSALLIASVFYQRHQVNVRKCKRNSWTYKQKIEQSQLGRCPPISPNPKSPNPEKST